MRRHNEKLLACEVGDMSGKPRQRMKPKRCKFKGCRTMLNSYHYGRYCHVHEMKAFAKESEKKYFSHNTFRLR